MRETRIVVPACMSRRGRIMWMATKAIVMLTGLVVVGRGLWAVPGFFFS